MRLALKECAASPLTVMAQGVSGTTSGQSGVHCPVTGSRESPGLLRLNSTTLVLTGATIGICSVSTAGTWLRSLGPQLLAMVLVAPGASTLGTALTTRNSSI